MKVESLVQLENKLIKQDDILYSKSYELQLLLKPKILNLKGERIDHCYNKLIF